MTTLIHTANIDNKLDKENIEPINLIINYFQPLDNNILKKIKKSLCINVSNPNINNIYLLNEKIYTKEELGIEKCKKEDISKIKQVIIKEKMSFKIKLNYIKDNNIKGYLIFTNSFIFFDNTVRNLLKTSLHIEKGVYALTDFKFSNKSLRKCKITQTFNNGIASIHNTWIIHSNFIPKNTKIFNINLNLDYGSKLIYLFLILGYKLYNDYYFIKTYNNFSKEVKKEFLYWWYKFNEFGNIKKPLGILLPNNKLQKNTALENLIVKHSNVWNKSNIVNLIDNMQFDCNKILISYLKNKIENNKNFLIPKIGIIESEIVYTTHIVNNKVNNMLFISIEPTNKLIFTDKQKKEIENQLHYTGIKDKLYDFKNDRGIQINSTIGLVHFTKMYLNSFKDCEIYTCLDNFTKDNIRNSEKHTLSFNFIINNLKKKECINSSVFDIFNSLHNPWTHILKGKRILIISPFIELIKKKENIRENIYDIDLFPNCNFVYKKCPITNFLNNRNNESFNLNKELKKFSNEITEIKDTFDIALCDCLGGGNIFSNIIYNLGKSAINIGNVLQMYFGIYNKNWIKERKEIIQLYLNNNWSNSDK